MSVQESGAGEKQLLAEIAALKKDLVFLSRKNADLSEALNREKDSHCFYKHHFNQCQSYCNELDWECQRRYWDMQKLCLYNANMKRYIKNCCSAVGPSKRASKSRIHCKKSNYCKQKYRDFGKKIRISLETIKERDEPPLLNSNVLSKPCWLSSTKNTASDQAHSALEKSVTVLRPPRPEYVVITMPDDDDDDVTFIDKNLQTTFDDDDGYSSSSSNSSCRDGLYSDQVNDVAPGFLSRDC